VTEPSSQVAGFPEQVIVFFAECDSSIRQGRPLAAAGVLYVRLAEVDESICGTARERKRPRREPKTPCAALVRDAGEADFAVARGDELATTSGLTLLSYRE